MTYNYKYRGTSKSNGGDSINSMAPMALSALTTYKYSPISADIAQSVSAPLALSAFPYSRDLPIFPKDRCALCAARRARSARLSFQLFLNGETPGIGELCISADDCIVDWLRTKVWFGASH